MLSLYMILLHKLKLYLISLKMLQTGMVNDFVRGKSQGVNNFLQSIETELHFKQLAHRNS